MTNLNSRMEKILKKIIKYKYITIDNLSKELEIANRTIYYEISKINDYLKDNKLGKIKNARGQGFYVELQDKDRIQNEVYMMGKENYIFTSCERVSMIILDLLENQNPQAKEQNVISSNQEMRTILFYEKKFQVSKNTIVNDILTVKRILKDYTLDIGNDFGYYIIGNGHRKREIYSYQFNNYRYLFDFKPELELEKFKEIEIINKRQVLEYLEIYYSKIYINSDIDIEEIKQYFHNQEQCLQIASKIKYEICSQYQIEIEEKEVYFIGLLLLTDESIVNNFLAIETKQCQEYYQTILQITKNFEKFACVDIDHKENLSTDMMNHLIPYIVRSRVGIYYANEMKQEVKSMYSGTYYFTKKAILAQREQIENFKFTEDMISYIAMYFGAIVYAQTKEEKIPKIVIVCCKGYATSQLLRIQIEEILGKIEILSTTTMKEIQGEEYDYLITTSDVNENEKVIQVNPILSEYDKSKLVNQIRNAKYSEVQSSVLNKIIVKVEEFAEIKNKEALKKEIGILIGKTASGKIPIPQLNEILSHDKIQLLTQNCNWKAAVQIGAKPLLVNQDISISYVDKMISNVLEYGSYMVSDNGFAIIHSAREDGVNRLGITLTVFRDAVIFPDNKKVKMLIVLAPIDKTSHFDLLLGLNKIVQSKDKYKRIIESKDIYELITNIKYQ